MFIEMKIQHSFYFYFQSNNTKVKKTMKKCNFETIKTKTKILSH